MVTDSSNGSKVLHKIHCIANHQYFIRLTFYKGEYTTATKKKTNEFTWCFSNDGKSFPWCVKSTFFPLRILCKRICACLDVIVSHFILYYKLRLNAGIFQRLKELSFNRRKNISNNIGGKRIKYQSCTYSKEVTKTKAFNRKLLWILRVHTKRRGKQLTKKELKFWVSDRKYHFDLSTQLHWFVSIFIYCGCLNLFRLKFIIFHFCNLIRCSIMWKSISC